MGLAPTSILLNGVPDRRPYPSLLAPILVHLVADLGVQLNGDAVVGDLALLCPEQ
jgi:hypothetical protein